MPPPAADRRHLHQFDYRLFAETLAQAGLRLMGMSGRGFWLRWLVRRRPDLFSDMLIATAAKISSAEG